MARPRKNTEDKQTRKYDFGVNNEELNLLNKFHLDSGTKIRDYILNNLDKKPNFIYVNNNKVLLKQIAKIGINVNQMAKISNSKNNTSHLDYDILLKEIENIKLLLTNLNDNIE